MFEGQPKGLFALALANTGERFGYYTMLAIFVILPGSACTCSERGHRTLNEIRI